MQFSYELHYFHSCLDYISILYKKGDYLFDLRGSLPPTKALLLLWTFTTIYGIVVRHLLYQQYRFSTGLAYLITGLAFLTN